MTGSGGKIGATSGGCRLGMSQQGANNRTSQALGPANTCMTMSKIVQAQGIDPGELKYPFAAVLLRNDRLPGAVTRKIVICPINSG